MNDNSIYFNPEQNSHTPEPFKSKRGFHLSKRDLIFTLLFLLISFIISNFVIFSGFYLGFTITFILLFIVTSAYFYDKRVKASAFSYICGALSLAGSVSFAVYDDWMINTIMFFLIFALYTLYICGISNTFAHNRGSFKIIIDALYGVFVSPLKNAGNVTASYTQYNKKSKNFKSILIGVALAVPVMLVIIPLLMSSDVAFSSLVSHIFSLVGMYIGQFAFTLLIFPIIILHFVSKAKNNDSYYKSNGGKKFKGVFNGGAVTAFLAGISLIYVVYLFSQFAYFFSAFSGILPEGYVINASEYARRGFFEMFAIAVINMIIITLCCLFTKRNKGKIPLCVKLFSCFILLFTTLLLITSMVKMKLNIDTYALSKNRVLVSVFMVMIFVVILFYLIHLFFPKFSYMQPVIIICSVIFMCLAYSNVDMQIAKYNTEAYTSGKFDEIDISHIKDLSPAGVPYLIELTQCDDHIVSKQAKTAVAMALQEQFGFAFDEDNKKLFPKVTYERESDLRIYNLDKENAKKQLAEYYNSLTDDEKEKLITQYFFDESAEKYYSYDEETDEYIYAGDEYEYHYSYDSKDDRYEYSGAKAYGEYAENNDI